MINETTTPSAEAAAAPPKTGGEPCGSSQITNYELRITNSESPITNHQLPITNHESRITNYMITVWMHKMFLEGSPKDESDLSLETEDKITLYELLDRVCGGDETLRFKLLDEQKNLRPHVNIFIGTKNCRNLDGIETAVSPNDEVSVFPSLSGG